MNATTSISSNIASIEEFQIRESVTNKLKHRFQTYGYKQIRTSTFENYDMYSTIIGTVNKDEMIKTVDSSGKVLVLRPDVTIPISRMIALDKKAIKNRLRYFYVLDIFRQSLDSNDKKENTQAGIEYFGEDTPEADAETLMLAIHTSMDLGLSNFKIEIGNAGFIKELLDEASLAPTEMEQLKMLIQSKNIAELESYLANLSLDGGLRSAILTIPLLYGNPGDVIEQAKTIVRNGNMQLKLENLIRVVNILKDYDVEKEVVFNLGLINHMNYYSDLIFQGFTEDVGKPILMGGRYDNLGKQFDHPIPAIGFAFDVDSLVQVLVQQAMLSASDSTVEFIILYEMERRRDALLATFKLREKGYQVIASPLKTSHLQQLSSGFAIHYKANQNMFISERKRKQFADFAELTQLIQIDEVN